MSEMMDMMNAMAKEKGTVKPKDKTVEGQSGEFKSKGSIREQVPTSKYNVENPFVIRVNKLEGGISESSSSKTTTNLAEAREEKDMRGHVSLPLKYAELLPMLIDNKLVTPVRSVPKKPPFPKGYLVPSPDPSRSLPKTRFEPSTRHSPSQIRLTRQIQHRSIGSDPLQRLIWSPWALAG
ncbi:hypothetical protein V6N11_018322 [Hibiscus sabdariffa]|uniref:Uncharacterized protein n=1 Tax=Hibiscus sabdariffa TaxID=183260 RepID=A0ABR2T7N9_9ROSI